MLTASDKTVLPAAFITGETTIKTSGNSNAGIALDIGTTTIAAASVELETGRIINATSVPNPQSAWGTDVLSRVTAIKANPDLLQTMGRVLIDSCNEAAGTLLHGEEASEICIAGNSVMEHILLGISPEVFAAPPFKPAFRKTALMPCSRLGLNARNNAAAYVFPLIGGFVGGDTTALILALGLHKKETATLTIDIGTNSEIVLTAGGLTYATAAAAGPAFESGGIRDGMTARPGAISGVRLTDESVSLEVIDKRPPSGICGSGLISAAAAMLEAGILDNTGRIVDRSEVTTNIGNRITESTVGNSFTLYRGARREIILTQQDIRSLQTAKAAIRAAVSVLMEKADIDAAQIDKVWLAGAFGVNLDKDALARIGLLEPDWLNRVELVGDAALTGAAMAVGSEVKKNEAESAASMVKYVALSGTPRFEREFLKEMNFNERKKR